MPPMIIHNNRAFISFQMQRHVNALSLINNPNTTPMYINRVIIRININIHERDASYTQPKGYSRSVSDKWRGELSGLLIRVII